MKYIYLIQSLENSYYKIGVSKHPNKRLSELQTGNPSSMKLITLHKTEYAHQIEKTLHRRYSHLNREGEWYNLSVANEVSFIEECKKIENNLLVLEKNDCLFI